jgi:hypothetical protein
LDNPPTIVLILEKENKRRRKKRNIVNRKKIIGRSLFLEKLKIERKSTPLGPPFFSKIIGTVSILL